MNEMMQQFLSDRLYKLNMPKVADLLKSGAEPIVILDAFEESVLERNEIYPKMLRHQSVELLSQDILRIMKAQAIQEGIIRNHEYRLVYSMLKAAWDRGDCGCSGPN